MTRGLVYPNPFGRPLFINVPNVTLFCLKQKILLLRNVRRINETFEEESLKHKDTYVFNLI